MPNYLNEILEEFSQEYEILKEDMDQGQRVYKIRGVMSKAGVINKNKRLYPLVVMKESVGDVQTLIEANRFLGEINHPKSPAINMDKISHKVTKLQMTEDGVVIGEMVPAGPYKDRLISIIEDGIGFGVSTRGTGSVKPSNGFGEGIVEVTPGYKLRAIDIVHDPSAGTYPSVVKEATENIFTIPSKFKDVWDEVFNS
jgi:hypothetical protein